MEVQMLEMDLTQQTSMDSRIEGLAFLEELLEINSQTTNFEGVNLVQNRITWKITI